MSIRRHWWIVSATALWAALPSALHAQQCSTPPAVKSTEAAIRTATAEGVKLLQAERTLTGSARVQTTARRRQLFRRISFLNWRYFCDNRIKFDDGQRAVGLVRGVLFFYLGGDRQNAQHWLPGARASVQTVVIRGSAMPVVLKQPIDRLALQLSAQLKPRPAYEQEWFDISIGKIG